MLIENPSTGLKYNALNNSMLPFFEAQLIATPFSYQNGLARFCRWYHGVTNPDMKFIIEYIKILRITLKLIISFIYNSATCLF